MKTNKTKCCKKCIAKYHGITCETCPYHTSPAEECYDKCRDAELAEALSSPAEELEWEKEWNKRFKDWEGGQIESILNAQMEEMKDFARSLLSKAKQETVAKCLGVLETELERFNEYCVAHEQNFKKTKSEVISEAKLKIAEEVK